MNRHRRRKQPAGLNGYKGLLTAVIFRAVTDAQSYNRSVMLDAWAYIGGDEYKTHLRLLGLDEERYPVELLEMPVDDFITLTDRLMGHDG